jgi:hypothetical protein
LLGGLFDPFYAGGGIGFGLLLLLLVAGIVLLLLR